MAGDILHTGGQTAMGQRHARDGRGPLSGGNAGHIFDLDAMVGQMGRLFRAAAEDQGIAPLQAGNIAPGLGLFDQNFVDPVLRHGVAFRRFANKDHLCIRARHGNDVIGHQPVIDHAISGFEVAHSFHRHKFGVARTCANQEYFAGHVISRSSN